MKTLPILVVLVSLLGLPVFAEETTTAPAGVSADELPATVPVLRQMVIDQQQQMVEMGRKIQTIRDEVTAAYAEDLRQMREQVAAMKLQVEELQKKNLELQVKLAEAKKSAAAPAANPSDPGPAPAAPSGTVVFADVIAGMPDHIARNAQAKAAYIGEHTNGKIVVVTGKVSKIDSSHVELEVFGSDALVYVTFKARLTSEQLAQVTLHKTILTLRGPCTRGRIVQQ